ncbi:hypothetical protein F4780DRAFT_775533 [Xylariomycetidae sp. FL0641]|nr:hypothetical protein F4780DRAFT_775533 [Xylariomycetidae sp. FL0641]
MAAKRPPLTRLIATGKPCFNSRHASAACLPHPNYMVDSLLPGGKFAQNAEEGRLKKRQKRVDKALEKDRDGAEEGITSRVYGTWHTRLGRA